MAKLREKILARQLRTKGFSIKQIADQLQVSKSTASVWCRDVVLSDKAVERLVKSSTHRNVAGLLHYSETQRHIRQSKTKLNKEAGQLRLGTPTDRDVYCIGLGLYWGEGYKNGNREFGFNNSDPQMILFYIKWLETVFSIQRESLTLRVSINATHQNRITSVESYWSYLTDVPPHQFTKSSLIKTTSKKRYKNHNDHYGTLRVKVQRGSDFREQVLGAIEGVTK